MLTAVRVELRTADSSFAGSVFAGSLFEGSLLAGASCPKAAAANRIRTIRLGIFIRQYYIGRGLRFATKPTAKTQQGAEKNKNREIIPVFIRVHLRLSSRLLRPNHPMPGRPFGQI